MSDEQPEFDMTPGRFCWNELLTTDVEAAKKFYSEMFGWTAELMEGDHPHDYWVLMNNGMPLGGLLAITEEMGPVPPHWMGYVSVEKVEDANAKAEAGGGKVMVGPVEIPGKGRFSVIQDPQGAVFSVWEFAQG